MANKVIRLTESDLERIIKRVIAEQEMEEGLFGPSKEEKETSKNELIRQMEELVQEEGLTENDLFNSFQGILKKAEDGPFKYLTENECVLKTLIPFRKRYFWFFFFFQTAPLNKRPNDWFTAN